LNHSGKLVDNRQEWNLNQVPDLAIADIPASNAIFKRMLAYFFPERETGWVGLLMGAVFGSA